MKFSFATPMGNSLEIEMPVEDKDHPYGLNNPAIKKYTFVPKLEEAAKNQSQTVSYASFVSILSEAKQAMEKMQNEPKSTSGLFQYSIMASWLTVTSDLTFLNRIHQKLKEYDLFMNEATNSAPRPTLRPYC